MTSVFKPLKSAGSLILVGIMATMGLAAVAQTVAPAGPATSATPANPGAKAGERRHDPAEMQAYRAKRHAELKTRLAITATQEGAWTAYTAAMQPTARSGASPDRAAVRAELEKRSTPERIDKMRELRTQRIAEINATMDKRGDATKTFYAALSAEQKKVFDSQSMGHSGKGHGGHHGHASHHGKG